MSYVYRTRQMLSDRSFRISLLASLTIASGVMLASAKWVEHEKFVVTPVAEVSVVYPPAQPRFEELPTHIISTAEFIQLINADKGDVPKGVGISGFVTNLAEFCKSTGNGDVAKNDILLAKYGTTEIIGVDNNTGGSCKNVSKLGENDGVYVASDIPLAGLNSTRILMTLDNLIIK